MIEIHLAKSFGGGNLYRKDVRYGKDENEGSFAGGCWRSGRGLGLFTGFVPWEVSIAAIRYKFHVQEKVSPWLLFLLQN